MKQPKLLLVSIFFALLSLSSYANNKVVNLFGHDLAEHPRLLFTAERESNIKQLLEDGDSTLLKLHHLNLQVADELLAKAVQPLRYSSRKNLLGIARETFKRVTVLGTAYRLTGDQKYADKLVDNVLNICAYPDWNTKHYLDVAEFSASIAIAYDWMYDYLTAEQRKIIRTAWAEKALAPSLERLGGYPFDKENNWNIVCNAGISLGCIAFAEYYPEGATMFLAGSATDSLRMPRSLAGFAPDGVCYEGAGYWGYTMRYLVLYMDACDYSFPDDERFAIGDLPGLDKTMNYRLATITPGGMMFRFADVAEFDSEEALAAYYFLSQKYDQKEMADYQSDLINRPEFGVDEYQRHHTQPLSIAWYVPGSGNYTRKQTSGIQVFRGPTSTDVVVVNGGDAEDDIFLLAKTGSPSMSHQHLDASSFVVEVNGHTVFHDMGAESYNVPNYWKRDPESKRWYYFKTSSKSHNVIEIDDKIMNSYGRSVLKDVDTKADQPYVVMDNSTLYPEVTKEVTRKFTLLNSKTVELSDKVDLTDASSTVVWRGFMWGDTVIVEGDKLTLHGEDNSRFYLKISSPQGATFEVLEEPRVSHWLTKGLEEAPYYRYLRPLSEQVQRAEIRVSPETGSGSVELTVLMSADKAIIND